MKKFDTTDLKPCPHMRLLVSAHVDGKLGGIAAWYTSNHIKGCAQCQASIPFLNTLKDRLSELESTEEPAGLSDDRLKDIAEGLKRVDTGETA